MLDSLILLDTSNCRGSVLISKKQDNETSEKVQTLFFILVHDLNMKYLHFQTNVPQLHIIMLSSIKQLSIIPRYCHTRSNSPSYTPLLDVVKIRQEQARRSVLVQVAGPNSALDLASYCHEKFGPVESLHYFNNKFSKNFTHFFIVNFCDSSTVKTILTSAQHSVSDGISASPVPVYSPFLWLQGGNVSKNLKQFKSVPVDYGKNDISEQKIQNISDISEQMYQLWKMYNMTDTSLRLRFLVCRQVELAISGMFPHAQVLPFGSAINGFGTCSSDQDMVLDLDLDRKPDHQRLVFHAKGAVYGGDRAQVQRYCEELASIIQSFLPGCQDVQKILNARVPIIKYTHELAGLECDLSMSSSSGLHMSCLLHLWGHMDWRVRPLVASVRRWAKSVGLVKEMRPTPLFTNFTITMLVVCYLQHIQMLPSYSVLSDNATEEDSYQCKDGVICDFLHNINNQKEQFNKCYNSPISLSELLQGFFEYYALYDFSKNVLCPITGTSKLKTRRWTNSSSLDLINPLEPNLNVSYNVNAKSVEKFKEQCRVAIKKMNEWRKNKEAHPGLFFLFENEDLRPQRPKVIVPNLFDLDLLGDEDSTSNKSTKNKFEVSELFEEEKADKATTVKSEPTEDNIGKPGWNNENEISLPLRESRENITNNKHRERLISKKAFQNIFSAAKPDVKLGSEKSPAESLTAPDKGHADPAEEKRIDKLKVKYLRSNAKSKFSHKM